MISQSSLRTIKISASLKCFLNGKTTIFKPADSASAQIDKFVRREKGFSSLLVAFVTAMGTPMWITRHF